MKILSKIIFLSFLFFININAFAWNEKSIEEESSLRLKPDIEHGEKMYTVCARCHQKSGYGTEDGRFPQIAGQHKNVIIKQLADIRARNRDNPTMAPFVMSTTFGGAQGLADIAEYVSSLSADSHNGKGPGGSLELGRSIYTNKCMTCHGESGQGNNERFFPRLQGQHYRYLVRQLLWIRDGKRRNANPKMMEQIKDFKGDDIVAVADYISRLKEPNRFLK